jgi:chromosome partitioning protein
MQVVQMTSNLHKKASQMYISSMAKSVAIIIPKGGCGKTTTTANLAAYVSKQGYRVLAVDFDPQGNLSQHLGYAGSDIRHSIGDVMLGEVATEAAIIAVDENLSLLANNYAMVKMLPKLQGAANANYLLRDILYPLNSKYQFIFIDAPPALGFFAVNTLIAATDILLTVSPEFFPMQAIRPLYELYQQIRQSHNLSLQLKGVILTMADMRLRHSREIVGILRKNFGSLLYEAYVRNNVALKEASSYGLSIFAYQPTSIGALDYALVGEEFLRDFAPAQRKREYYNRLFSELPAAEQEEIMEKTKNHLENLQQQRENSESSTDLLKQIVLLTRNSEVEKRYPYRKHKD